MDPVIALQPDCYLKGKVVRAVGCFKPVYAFLGVPYAQPPVGELRFKHTQPIAKLWKGTRDATEFGSICPQNTAKSAKFYGPFPIPDNQSEDCLFLNVWTPTLEKIPHKRLPVIVYIHGGAYQNSFSNMHNGTAHAAFENVVFVSINYRLGAFGFLYTGNGIAPGNMGITDVIEAFAWVQQYIAAFGGDSGNVTCMGESAGGFLVTLMMVISKSRGLYHKAISQSGVCTDAMVWTATQAERFFIKRLERRGYPRGSIGNMNSFMQNIAKEELIRIYDGGTVPVIDGTLLKEHPRTSFLHGHSESVPFLVGFTSSDGYEFAEGHVLSSLENDDKSLTTNFKVIEKAVNGLLMEMFRRAAREKGVDKLLLNEYGLHDQESISRNEDLLLQKFSQMATDAMFGAPTIFAALCHSAHSPVFLFEFDHRPPGIVTPAWVRSRHADDLPYTIGYPFLEAPHPYNNTTPETFDGSERRFCHEVMQYWCNFAKHGNPNRKSSLFWPNFTAREQEYVVLNKKECRVESFYEKKNMELWNNRIFPLLGYAGIASKY